MWRKIITFLFDSVYQVVTWVWIGVSISAFFFFASNKSNSGMVLSVVSLLAAILVMLSLMAKKHFWDGEAEKIQQRPELYVSGARMTPLHAGQPERVVLGIKNRGNATARNIRLGGGNHFFASSSFTGPLEYQSLPVDTRPDIGPGEEKSIVSSSSEPLSIDRIKDLQRGELLFFHYAEGDYEDESGATYPIDFCFMYAPLSPTAMRICPEKYWPKERKDRKMNGRPELSLEQAKVIFRPGKSAMVRLYLLNRGNLPARNIGLSGVQIMRAAQDQRPLQLGTLGEPDRFPSLAVNAGMQASTYGASPMSIKEIADVTDGKRSFLHYTEGHYEDEWGRRYPFRICLLYMPNVPGLEDDMAIAPRQYWPREPQDGSEGKNRN
jgi:hypothetical protein